MNITPFTCSACGARFHELGGGICRRCGRLLCGKHLRLRREGAVCDDCLRIKTRNESSPKRTARGREFMNALLTVLSLVVAILVIWVEGIQLLALWNLLPVAAAAAAAIGIRQRAARTIRLGRNAFCVTTLLAVTLLHLAWHFDWGRFATGSSTAGLIFVFAPLYTLGAAALVAVIAASVAELRGGSRDRSGSANMVVILLPILATAGCDAFGFSNRVLLRIPSPDGSLVAVCQEVPVLDGPDFDVRLERPDGSLVRRLAGFGDADGCTEMAWSPDGRRLAMLTGHVARIRLIDVAWALDHQHVETAHWSWRQVDLSTERKLTSGSALKFVTPDRLELQLCPGGWLRGGRECPVVTVTHRVDLPTRLVTGH